MITRRWQREKAATTVKRFETPEDAIAALQNDPTIDALLIDNVSLRIAQGRGAAIRSVGASLESNPYVIAMPLGAFELQKKGRGFTAHDAHYKRLCDHRSAMVWQR